ncbi:MAG: hypothetical protein R3C99_22950 [Pirellulaceae bacterium]
MNYFAHAYRFLADPYFVAGTATPDWLSVVNRRSRARERLAVRFIDDDDPLVRAVARGIVRHHRDDDWFHRTRAFAELSLEFTLAIRDSLPADDGFRPSFLGHILVELLLDAELIAEHPERLDAYYRVLDALDVDSVSRAVNQMVTEPAGMLPLFIPRFSAERFLYDYADDGKLLFRLNGVMRRVKLPPLPESFRELFPAMRRQVADRKLELLREP